MEKATPLHTPEEQPEACDGTAAPKEKKKSLDEMIAKFNQDNPGKNPKKIYRGVY